MYFLIWLKTPDVSKSPVIPAPTDPGQQTQKSPVIPAPIGPGPTPNKAELLIGHEATILKSLIMFTVLILML